MNADDVLEFCFRFEAEIKGALWIEVLWPALNDAHDGVVGYVLDVGEGGGCDSFEGGELLCHCAGQAGEGEVAAVAQFRSAHDGGLCQEADGGAGGGMPVADGCGDGQDCVQACQWFADDV